MKRGLFTLASALSLLLCMATIVLWVRSHWFFDGYGVFVGRLAIYLRSMQGHANAGVYWANKWVWDPSWGWEGHPAQGMTPVDTNLQWLYGGFGYSYRAHTMAEYTATETACGMPHWFLTALLATISVITYRLQVQRTNLGDTCPACSYNLTGNTSGVCPECGNAATSSQTSLS